MEANMDLAPFTALKEKIDQLIQNNIQLRKQKDAYSEKLRMQDGEIERLHMQCRKYDLQNIEARHRIDQLINQLKEIGIGP